MSRKLTLGNLKDFCKEALIKEGMQEEYAAITAEVLALTDAYGINSHGTKNLYGYISKAKAGGMALNAAPEVINEGEGFAVIDAKNGMGMVSSYKAMEMACDKAANTGIALVTVKNSNHFGAAGYYSNIAAKRGMFGIAMSNVDPNMTVPGARGMILGNNPLSFASPLSNSSIFLDIAMSNVASLKVIQAAKNGQSIPDTWIVDKNGLPTTDPSNYPKEGAMQPMAAHKGYGFAVMVELLTGVLSGGGISSSGEIVSWCFELDKPNNVCHTFIAIDVSRFTGAEKYEERSKVLADCLHNAPKALGKDRIYLPGEIEWDKYNKYTKDAIEIPDSVITELEKLEAMTGIKIKWA